MKWCFSCGGLFRDIDGPVHRYMNSSPGCWGKYGEVLAKEYSDAAFSEIHRLTVDAYAVQHPGSTNRQSIQSVGVHLIRLCLLLEQGLDAKYANDAMLEAGKNNASFTFLEPPTELGGITAANFDRANRPDEHIALVRAWAQCAWDAWGVHHHTVRTWLPKKYR